MSVVGDRYAESLFDLAKEENKVTQYLDDIKLVGEVLDSDPQIVQFFNHCLLYTSPSPRDAHESRMPSSA